MGYMEKFLPWLALKSVPGVGNLIFKRLVDRFKSPEAVFQASSGELGQVSGMSQRLARQIRRYRVPGWVHAELELAARKGYRIITLLDPDYPALLHEIPDPPPFLLKEGGMVLRRAETEQVVRTMQRNLTGQVSAQGRTPTQAPAG